MMKEITTVFITDDNYVVQTAVAATSLKESHRGKKVKTYIVGHNLSDINKQKISELQSEEFEVIFIDPENRNRIKGIKGPDEKYVAASKAALYKFDLPNLINEEKVLYLDGDVVVKGDLSELFTTNIDNVYAAVVSDLPQVLYQTPVFDEGNGKKYFNTGMMLLNLTKMRADNITELLFEDRLTHSNDLLMDQNSFNRVFGAKIKLVSPVYNCTIANLTRSKNRYNFDNLNALFNENFVDLYELEQRSVIIHYSSKDKPWTYFDAPAADIWIKNFNLSPFSGIRLKRYSKESGANVSYKRIYFEDDSIKNEIPVVFCTNDKYVPNLLVSAHSVLKNYTGDKNIKIFVLHKELTRENIVKIESLDKRITVINVEKLLSENEKKLKTCGHFTSDMYLRWYIPEIFYQYDKVIYLDCDLLCLSNIKDLFEMPLNGKIFGACLNLQDRKKAEYREKVLGISFDKYVNSGVLVIDPHGFIKNDCKSKLFNFVRTHPKIDCPDQDALNVICFDQIEILDYIWNVQWHHYFQSKGKELKFDWDEYINKINNPKILHYTSNIKPWADKTKFKADLFWQYANEIGVSCPDVMKCNSAHNGDELHQLVVIIKEMIANSECSKLDLASNNEFKTLNYRSRLFLYAVKQKDVDTATHVIQDIVKYEICSVEECYRKRLLKIGNSFSMKLTRPLRKMETIDATLEKVLQKQTLESVPRVYFKDNVYYLIRFIRKIFSENKIFKQGTAAYSKTYTNASPRCKEFFFAIRNNDIEAAYAVLNNILETNIQGRAKVYEKAIEDLYKLKSMIITRPIRTLNKYLGLFK